MRSVLISLLMLVCSLSSRSQLCSGSLGDPVAHISFGTGSSRPLPTGKTNYNFVSSTCPEDGSYTITDRTSACFGSTWHSVSGDHTPNDALGLFMLVNASTSPGVFYIDTIKSLCGNTVYEFSTYVMNVIKTTACAGRPNLPDLTFTIETPAGVKLTQYNTGEIQAKESPAWVQYGTYVTTPPDVTTVVIRINNNAPGGCGNDLAIDDIMFRPCGPKIETVVDGSKVSQISYCESSPRDITLTSNITGGFATPRLQWQLSNDGSSWTDIPGATSNSYIRKHSTKGVYYYRLVVGDGDNINNTSCRIATESIVISVNGPALVAANQMTGCKGTRATLAAEGAVNYSWTGPNGFSSKEQKPVIQNIQYKDSGLYVVTGTSSNGCAGTANIRLEVFEEAKISVTPTVSACEGQPIQLNASGGVRIKWTPSAGLNYDTIYNPVATVNLTTAYKATVYNQFGCSDTATVQAIVLKAPVADAGPDLSMLRDKSIQLKSTVMGTDVTHSWTPISYMLDPTAVRPVVNPPDNTRYRLTVSSNVGCGISSDEMEVKVYDQMKIPNTFTPNGDGYNDVWEINLLPSFESSTTEVYNTTGQLVYRSIGYSKAWDGTRNGKPLPAGTYYYVIDVKLPKSEKFVGYVTIIR